MARKARNYKAEYARRKASGQRRGQTLREARGHKNESVERKERRQRTREVYGVSPERLSRLRKAAEAHILAGLAASGTKGPSNRAAIQKGVRLLSGEMLQEFVQQAAPADFKRLASMSYQALILEYPELENDDERNPFWYHA